MAELTLEQVRYERDGHIAIVTIDRQERLNAISNQTSRELFDVWRDFRLNDDLWVAVLTGAGDRAFSAGADLIARHSEGDGGPHHQGIPMFGMARGEPVFKPIIAAINGYALGGGLELALCCDIRIASERARFGVPEVKLGVFTGAGGSQRLPRAIPSAIANEMLLTGEPIDAREAHRVGLINRVVPHDELMPAAMQMARTVGARGPLAVRAAKEAMLRGLDMPLAHGLALEEHLGQPLSQTEDWQEGLTAFIEKREPRFQGR